MFIHGSGGAHSIKHHIGSSRVFNYLTFTLIMTRKHSSEHDIICSGTKGLGNIPRPGTTAVTDDMPAKTVSRIGTFDDR